MIPFGTQKAPSPSVVLPYYTTAALVFLLLSVLLLVSASDFTGHYFQPHILTITHLATLGWGTMLIFGASHQLLPVIMEVHLFSERLARWCFYLLLPGIALLSVSFWLFTPGLSMQAGALLILLAFVLYAINVYGTAKQNKTHGIGAECIVTASWWLVLTALLGTLLVFNLRYAFLPESHLYYLKIHAHLGLAGWFLLLIMGVASRLMPMFLLSEVKPGKNVTVSYYCVNGALILFLVMTFFFHTEQYWYLPVLIALTAVVFYGLFLRKVYKKAVRKKKIDWPMKISLVSFFTMILPFVLLGILLFIEPDSLSVSLSLAYGMSILGGFITLLMFGQTFKTLPFIIWMHRYKKLLGKMKTPLPKDVYWHKMVAIMFACYSVALMALLIGVIGQWVVLIQIGAVALVLAAIGYNINVFHVLFHKVKNNSTNGQFGKTRNHGTARIFEGRS